MNSPADQCARCAHNKRNCELGLFPSLDLECPWFKAAEEPTESVEDYITGLCEQMRPEWGEEPAKAGQGRTEPGREGACGAKTGKDTSREENASNGL